MLSKQIALVTAALVFVAGCATATAGNEFTTAWDAADAKRKEAAAIGYEWRDTGKILKKAKAAADEGNNDKAMKLVAQALEQSSDAIDQHAREGSIWAARVPK